MPMTDPELRALAYLAVRMRPHGARRWDEGGVVANLRKVNDRDSADVAMATIRAARDRNVDSPGVIPTPGPHWNERLSEIAPPVRKFDRGSCCSICSLPEIECRTRWTGDHEYESTAHAEQRVEAGRQQRADAHQTARSAMGPAAVGPHVDPDARCSTGCIRGAGHTGDHLPPLAAQEAS